MIVWGFLVQNFLQAGCPSCCPTNSEKVLKEFRCLSSVNANGWDVNTDLFLSTEMVTGSGAGMPMF